MRYSLAPKVCSWLCAFLAATVSTIPCGRAEPRQGATAEAYIARLVGAADEYELHNVNEEMLDNFPPRLLDELSEKENDSVALLAKWAMVRNSIGPPVKDGIRWVPVDIDRARLARFLGFLEGRTRTVPPMWWQQRMLRLQGYDRYEMEVDRDLPPAPLFPPAEDSKVVAEDGRYRWQKAVRLWLGRGISDAKKRGHDVVLRVAEADISVSDTVLDDVEERTGNMPDGVNAICISPGRYLVALHGHVCQRFPLYLIDAQQQRPIWSVDVWAARPVVPGGSGPPDMGHWVDFRIAHEKAYVFGAGWNSMYVECFNLSDGKNQFRFSTSY